MSKLPSPEELFDLDRSIAGELIGECGDILIALSKIDEFIGVLGKGENFCEVREGVFIGRDVTISSGCEIHPPVIIDDGAEIRQGAYIRGHAIIGKGSVIGNSTEVKNSIIFDEGKLPHYSYSGDSIIGYRAHLGAGAIISNLRLDNGEVMIRLGDKKIPSGRRKLGAFIGDRAEIGSGAVLCPGSIIGRHAMVYPLTRVLKAIPEGKIFDGEKIRDRR